MLCVRPPTICQRLVGEEKNPPLAQIVQKRTKPSYDKNGETQKDHTVKSLVADVEQRSRWQKQAWRRLEVRSSGCPLFSFLLRPSPIPFSSQRIVRPNTLRVPRGKGFFGHAFIAHHQADAFDAMIDNLPPNAILILADYSMNYSHTHQVCWCACQMPSASRTIS